MREITVWALASMALGCGPAPNTPDGASMGGGDAAVDGGAAVDSGGGIDAGSGPGGPARLQGAVQKGPFVLGSSVTISVLDTAGNPTGTVFHATTADDAGSFEVTLPAPAPLAIEASGFYFDELRGQLSDAPIVLRAVYDPAEGSGRAYVNLVTHLTSARALGVHRDEGMPLGRAARQAEEELVAALGLGPDGFSLAGTPATDLDVLGASDAVNAYPLALSALFLMAAAEAGPIDAELSRLLNVVEADLADDGLLNGVAASVASTLYNVESRLPDWRVMDHLHERARLVDPSRDLTADPLPQVGAIVDTDHDGLVNASDNCDAATNPDQADTDGDGTGDVCDYHFVDVDVSGHDWYTMVCGVHGEGSVQPAGRVECWYVGDGVASPWQRYAPRTPGAEQWLAARLAGLEVTRVSVAGLIGCALLADRTVRCFRREAGGPAVVSMDPPSGTYNAITTGQNFACAISTARGAPAVCWNGTSANTLPGNWRAISATHTSGTTPDRVLCGIDAGTYAVECYDPMTDAPWTRYGTWPTMAVALDNRCAVGDDARVYCWGGPDTADDLGASPTLGFGFRAAAGALNIGTCGIRDADGTIGCVEDVAHPAYGGGYTRLALADFSTFSASAAQLVGCGLLEDGRLRCFGNDILEGVWTPW